MSVICYMSVICLVLGGVVRVRLYVIYAHLCNHMLLRSGGDLGHSSVHRQRCGFWESGCRRLARKRPARRGSGAPSTDWLGAWGCLFRSHGLLDWSTLSLSGNKNTHIMRRGDHLAHHLIHLRKDSMGMDRITLNQYDIMVGTTWGRRQRDARLRRTRQN